jgi:hypothetical protein
MPPAAGKSHPSHAQHRCSSADTQQERDTSGRIRCPTVAGASAGEDIQGLAGLERHRPGTGERDDPLFSTGEVADMEGEGPVAGGEGAEHPFVAAVGVAVGQ